MPLDGLLMRQSIYIVLDARPGQEEYVTSPYLLNTSTLTFKALGSCSHRCQYRYYQSSWYKSCWSMGL